MTFDHDWIAAHIPHALGMCLLDSVVEWDDTHVVCRASGHRGAAHPLAADGRLGVACALEYAAQAMAVHGALRAPGQRRPASGLLVGVRDVRFGAARLDDVAGDLAVEVHRLSGDDANVLYRFAVGAGGRVLAEGRAVVVLDGGRDARAAGGPGR
jgi:predicted hotdog family 3-hydroxylacyl-ACP dehydratase